MFVFEGPEATIPLGILRECGRVGLEPTHQGHWLLRPVYLPVKFHNYLIFLTKIIFYNFINYRTVGFWVSFVRLSFEGSDNRYLAFGILGNAFYCFSIGEASPRLAEARFNCLERFPTSILKISSPMVIIPIIFILLPYWLF
ncbi:MAG: hypothetical protein EOP48_11015 [Sphingobacteriales bacterium]|nr:MAG: hypothetical protein EOP48_11015 [Sphingobacteriales bacterium]